jgi:hypothetical protein
MTEPADLSVERLLAEAQSQTGLSDFGDPRFRDGLGVLVETYEGAGLTERGRKSTRRRLVQLLATRLRIEEAFRRHPEIRQRGIRTPVYLTGLPRTGTSALFNLLGIDAASRPLLTWEGIFPDPLYDLAPGEEDPRLVAMRERYEKARAKGLGFDAIHFVRPDGPEECVLLQSHAFCDLQLGVEILMEPYGEWFHQQDLRWMYSYYADLLRLLDWQRPGERWLLKSPAHLWGLDVLVEMFPDVCVIWTHRNPAEILASYCSMMEALMSNREHVDRDWLGAAVLENLALSLERGMRAREQAGPSRFVDVDYRTFVSAPLSAVGEIYEKFDLPFDDETKQAMSNYIESNPRGKHGAHKYSLEDYGLSPAKVADRLADYLHRFDVPMN